MKRIKKGSKINPAFLVMVGPVSLWMILLVLIPFIYVVAISFMKRSTYGGVELGFTLENILQVFELSNLKVFGQLDFYQNQNKALFLKALHHLMRK